MSAVKTKPRTNEKYSATISGTAFENGVSTRFMVKPTGERKRGFGYQKIFTGLTRDQLRQLADLMAEIASDLADEFGDDSTKMLAVYKDLGRFPEAANVR